MSDKINSVSDVKTMQGSSFTDKAKSNELGKDAFLKLLVTQMKYQDPLNPSTDTQFIEQLATFSQLEQMQNISKLTTNSQAFGLVGKEVVIKTESAMGEINYIQGRVDFVNMSNGDAQLSVNGKLYSIDQLDTILDDIYLLEQGLPGIKTKVNLEYDGENPKDLSFAVSLGEGDTVADQVAVIVDNKLLSSDLVKIKDSKIIIDKAALQDYPTGSYKIIVVFNDPYTTTVKDMVTLQIKNGAIEEPEEQEKAEEPEIPEEPEVPAEPEMPEEPEESENTMV